ncbi:MFS transporter [uncultured Halovibrio sp.]|uniref:MFS transporter n=1 Tax=uncultured Halovibrio sp. TaxID=985049 RepID=UPI0025DC3D74|nr:MFS transporter [uncultured Halovibrio sp.]
MKLPLPRFIQTNPSLALFALLATALSGFGQTFFISIFGSSLRDTFELSNATYGTYYSLATLCSAIVLVRLGTIVDRWSLANTITLALGLLGASALMLGTAAHWLLLIPGFFLGRLGGQGMMTHIGFTAASRYFDRDRGKIMALTVSGLPLSEALLPATGGLILAAWGWRSPWLLAAAFLFLLALPLMRWLARDARHPSEFRSHAHDDDDGASASGFTRRQALRDPGLYMALPGVLAVPFTVTAILFHQTAIAEIRGWSLEHIALAFSGYALGHFLMLFVAGPLVDRIGARRSLAMGLYPMVAGLVVMAMTHAVWTPFLYLALTGMSQGFAGTAGNALWPERYGVAHIGSIRSLAQAAMVLSTSASPALAGLALDAGMTPAGLGLTLAGATVAASMLLLLVPDTPRSSAS